MQLSPPSTMKNWRIKLIWSSAVFMIIWESISNELVSNCVKNHFKSGKIIKSGMWFWTGLILIFNTQSVLEEEEQTGTENGPFAMWALSGGERCEPQSTGVVRTSQVPARTWPGSVLSVAITGLSHPAGVYLWGGGGTAVQLQYNPTPPDGASRLSDLGTGQWRCYLSGERTGSGRSDGE